VTCTTWPAALLLHFRNRQLGNAEESGEVDAERAGEIGLAILGERFGDEDAGVVDQRVDTAEPGQAVGDHPLGGPGIGDVAGHGLDGLIERAVATTR
jgi:hypothetical protein